MTDYASCLDRIREDESLEAEREERFIERHIDDTDQIIEWLQHAVDDYDAALPIVDEIRKNQVLMDIAAEFIRPRLSREFKTIDNNSEY